MKVLVIGHNVAALVTALRLQQRGFSVLILEKSDHVEGPSTLPLIFQGPLTQTRALLKEIGSIHDLKTLPTVSLEFLTSSTKPTIFRPAYLPAPWHSLIGFLRCSALSHRSRWNFLNYLEKIWEGRVLLPQGLPLRTAQDWFISGQQHEEARRQFWNPLCLFLMNDHLGQTAAWPFIQTLKKYFYDARAHSTIRMSPLLHDDLLLTPLRILIQRQGGTFIPLEGLPQFHITGDHMEGLSVDNGRTYQADVYVSTVSPSHLVELLPERTLARLGFFHQLHQLRTVPLLVLQGTFPDTSLKPRIVITSSSFSWLTCQQSKLESGLNCSRISCVAVANEELISTSDDALRLMAFREIQRIFQGFDPSTHPGKPAIAITRQTRAFITHSPGTMTFRPSHHTPIANLWLAGYWTQRDAEPSLEADIHSANLCAASIKSRDVSIRSPR